MNREWDGCGGCKNAACPGAEGQRDHGGCPGCAAAGEAGCSRLARQESPGGCPGCGGFMEADLYEQSSLVCDCDVEGNVTLYEGQEQGKEPERKARDKGKKTERNGQAE